ncbi:MAG: fatty acid omega-hydroxylase [Pseudonocardiales bacterium]|jgi:cytochrome P450|nr:fatty acid omega-hydroxylase [Pseudonocardiales bacterium]
MRPEIAWAEAMKFENRPDPYRFFDELRRTPVARVADDLYVVTGYRELQTLTHDPRVSSDILRSPLPAKMGVSRESSSEAEPMKAQGRPPTPFILSDPPDHDRARRQAMRHFGPPHTPDLIPSMGPDIERLCDELLDRARGKTQIDLVDEYAYRVPLTVICKIMGVPLDDEEALHDWIFHGVAGVDFSPEAATEDGKARAAKGRESGPALRKYFLELIEDYLRKPGENLLSRLVNDDGPDGPMDPTEAAANAILLFIAGHDSTVNTISHCVLTLLRYPGSIELLRRRPDLIPRAVEEVLRLQSAVQFFPSRSATADIEVGGTVIPEGSAIFLMYGAANRDPRRFPDPNKFDPERPDNEHFGWGSGIHVCFGGPLARLEVNIALEVFLRRVENPRLVVDPPPYRRSPVFRGPQHLVIDYDRIGD